MSTKATLAMKEANTKHGLAKTRFWSIFKNMENRCARKNIPAYKKYGAKGIRCLWDSFESFREDMYESYLEHVKEFGENETTIERLDYRGDYCKENCRWATWKEQARNTSANRSVLFRGKYQSIAEIAETLGQDYHGVYARVQRGTELDRPMRKRQKPKAFVLQVKEKMDATKA